jgi:hypothetical protein
MGAAIESSTAHRNNKLGGSKYLDSFSRISWALVGVTPNASSRYRKVTPKKLVVNATPRLRL